MLRTAEDKLITLAKSDIEGIKDSRSLMPDGAVDALTKTELADLLRFLTELGKVGGQYTVEHSPRFLSLASGQRQRRVLLDQRLQSS